MIKEKEKESKQHSPSPISTVLPPYQVLNPFSSNMTREIRFLGVLSIKSPYVPIPNGLGFVLHWRQISSIESCSASIQSGNFENEVEASSWLRLQYEDPSASLLPPIDHPIRLFDKGTIHIW